MKLVLFDIDGTLLRTDGAGRRAMEHALHTVFGASGDATYRFDGKTDQQITREQMRAAGIDDAVITARMDDVFDTYAAQLEVELMRDPSASQLCAGILPLLDALEAESSRVTLGVLTGNIERGARQKLRAVGLEFSQFRANAFGCDHEHRPSLPAIAQRRAQELIGRTIPGDQIVIIGDTPADIQCGRSLGVLSIGVATGHFSVSDLTAHDPAAVFATLEDTPAVLSTILG